MGQSFPSPYVTRVTYDVRASHPGEHALAHGIPGTLCANNNDGDTLAQYDRMAHRWVLSQNVFVSPYATCIAISDTDDANWHLARLAVPGAR